MRVMRAEGDLEVERNKSGAMGDRLRKLKVENERLSANLSVLQSRHKQLQQVAFDLCIATQEHGHRGSRHH